MAARALVALFALVGASSSPAPPSAIVSVQYSVVSEDEPGNRGQLQMTPAAGESRTAVVWESACRLGGRTGALVPASDSDQYWSLTATLSAGSRPTLRIRHQHVRAGAPATPAQERVLPLDGATSLTLDGFSARTDCRYDRISVAITGRLAGSRQRPGAVAARR